MHFMNRRPGDHTRRHPDKLSGSVHKHYTIFTRHTRTRNLSPLPLPVPLDSRAA
jgi:hypothetical protein